MNSGRGRWGTPSAGVAGADDQESTAQAIASYDMAPPTGRNAYTPQNQAIMKRVREMNPQYNAPDYDASKHAVDRFDSGKQGDTVRSFNVLVGHLKTLNEAAESLNNGNIPLFNRIGNLIAQETGQEAPKDFNAVKHIVAAEIIKAVEGTPGALGDRDAVAAQIDQANSPSQMLGVIKHFKELAGAQMRGYRQQYHASTKRNDFDQKYLFPETQQTMGGSGLQSGPQRPNSGLQAPGSPLPPGWSIQKVN